MTYTQGYNIIIPPYLKLMSKLKPQPIPKDLPTYSTVLSSGKEVTMREAIAQDLLIMQSLYGGKSEMEQGLYLMSRLATGKNPITLEEIQVLPLRDFQALSELVAKCTGMSQEEEDQIPFG